jgi:hypothetical protein
MRLPVVVLGLLTALALPAAAKPPPPPEFTVDAAARQALVDDILRELDRTFVFPEKLKQQRGELVRRWSAPAFTRLTSSMALLHAINADLRALFDDKHLRLIFRQGMDPPAAQEPTAAELAEMEREEARRHFGFVRAEILDGNIGYLKIDGFADAHLKGTPQAVQDAIGFVGDSDGLVLDLRENHGGDGETVALLMSYLLEHKHLLLQQYDRVSGKTDEDWTRETVPGRRYGEKRPLWVLTSSETFSGAEELAYDVQNLKRGTLVGETTGGAANHNLFVVVGQRFVLSIPCGTVKSPVTGTNWEGVGVKPDLAAPRAQALDVALAAARRALGARADAHARR